MRRRKIIAISAVALLGVWLVVFFLMRDTGPPVEVHGDLSAKDVAQIKSAVRRELWREAFPKFFWKRIEKSPEAMKWVLSRRIYAIYDYEPPFRVSDRIIDSSGAQVPHAYAMLTKPEILSERGEGECVILAKWPDGWKFCGRIEVGGTTCLSLIVRMTNGH